MIRPNGKTIPVPCPECMNGHLHVQKLHMKAGQWLHECDECGKILQSETVKIGGHFFTALFPASPEYVVDILDPDFDPYKRN